MSYTTIEYSSRHKDDLKRIIEDSRYLDDLQQALDMARALHRELVEFRNRLSDCIDRLENRIQEYENRIAEAEAAARQAQADAMQAQSELARTPTTKVVAPTAEEAAKGAAPQVVPINQGKIQSLNNTIAQSEREAEQAMHEAQELERKLEPLRQDVKALSEGLAQVDEYLNLVRDVQYALNDGITEAKGKCEDRILPDIEKIAAWMEEYASVEIHSLHSECAGHIRRKE